MSDYQNKDMNGSVFKNTYKKLEKQPDYTGNAKIDGVDYKIAMWIKVKKDGNKYFSCSFQKADQEIKQKSSSYLPQDDIDDEIPFK